MGDEPLLSACDALAAAIEAGAVPSHGVSVLLEHRDKLETHNLNFRTRLAVILKMCICPQCELPSKRFPRCQRCRGQVRCLARSAAIQGGI